MKSLNRFKRVRKFFEVSRPNYSTHVLDLRPPFYQRYPLIAGFLVLAIITGIYGTRVLFTRADTIEFNATSCLGTWQNPHLAQGQPQTPTGSSDLISPSNSAIWYGGEGNIFCGGFVPEDFKPNGTIKEVGLSLIWRVGNPTTQLVTTSTVETTPTSTETEGLVNSTSSTSTSTIETKTTSTPKTNTSSTKNTNQATSTTTKAVKEEIVEQETTSTTKTSSSSISFWNWLTPIANAQEETSTTETVTSTETIEIEEAPTPTTTTTEKTILPSPATSTPKAETATTSSVTQASSTKITNQNTTSTIETTSTSSATQSTTTETKETIKLPPIIVTSLDESSSKEDSQSSTTIEVSTSTPTIPPPTPDDNFLKVSMSVDGANWEEVALINESNWQNFTASLSIYDWEDLKNLQVKIESIPSDNDSPPPVFLDGMFIETHYQTFSFFGGSESEIVLLPIGIDNERLFDQTRSTFNRLSLHLNGQTSPLKNLVADNKAIFIGWCGEHQASTTTQFTCQKDIAWLTQQTTSSSQFIMENIDQSSRIALSLSEATQSELQIHHKIKTSAGTPSLDSLRVALVLEYPSHYNFSTTTLLMRNDQYQDLLNLAINSDFGSPESFIIGTSSLYEGYTRIEIWLPVGSLPPNEIRNIDVKVKNFSKN